MMICQEVQAFLFSFLLTVAGHTAWGARHRSVRGQKRRAADVVVLRREGKVAEGDRGLICREGQTFVLSTRLLFYFHPTKVLHLCRAHSGQARVAPHTSESWIGDWRALPDANGLIQAQQVLLWDAACVPSLTFGRFSIYCRFIDYLLQRQVENEKETATRFYMCVWDNFFCWKWQNVNTHLNRVIEILILQQFFHFNWSAHGN